MEQDELSKVYVPRPSHDEECTCKKCLESTAFWESLKPLHGEDCECGRCVMGRLPYD